MITVVIAFLWLSLCLYLILGGADFGAGIVELFASKKTRKATGKIMYQSIAPVWEANHMWLIIAIVILFVGFPEIYSTLSIYLHIPLALMLLGIIARGTAFTFRHYDAVKDNWQVLYTEIFYYGSLLTPFFLGLIAASTFSGSINPDAQDFVNLYIFSWLNWFGISVGLFTIALCAYLASIFSLQNIEERLDLTLLIRKSKVSMIFVLLTGLLVFVSAYLSEIPLWEWVFSKPLGIIAISLATIALVFIFYCLKKRQFFPVRFLAGFQLVMILIAGTYQHYPNLILLGNGDHLSLLENAAPEKTLNVLGWALLIGSAFILPFLFYLMYSFTRAKKN